MNRKALSISIFFLLYFPIPFFVYLSFIFFFFIYYPFPFSLCHYFHRRNWPVTSHPFPETHKFHNQYILRLTLYLCNLKFSLYFILSWERRMQTYKSVNKRQKLLCFYLMSGLCSRLSPKSHNSNSPGSSRKIESIRLLNILNFINKKQLGNWVPWD